MAKYTFEKGVTQFTKVIDYMDKVVDENQAEVDNYSDIIASMESKKQACASEVDKATKLKNKLSEFLDI